MLKVKVTRVEIRPSIDSAWVDIKLDSNTSVEYSTDGLKRIVTVTLLPDDWHSYYTANSRFIYDRLKNMLNLGYVIETRTEMVEES